jgi:MFS transporter, DHA2 family, multidrug resistance protein
MHQRLDQLLILLLAGISPALLIAISIAEPYAGKAMNLPAAEIIWFAEAFLIGTLAVMPLSGTLLTRMGFVRLTWVCLAGTLLSGVGIVACDVLIRPQVQDPVLCLMVLAGVFSAPLAPAAQAFAVATHPAELRGQAMALWGGGRFAGFLLTALLAGHLIENLGWSFPLAIGLVMALPCFAMLHQPSRLLHNPEFGMDLRGLCLLLLALVPLLLALNLGPLFNSDGRDMLLVGMLIVTLVAGVAFVRHALRKPDPIVSLAPLIGPDFRIATFVAFIVAVMTTGQFSILMVSELAKVSADMLGWRTTVGGVAQIVGVAAGGYLVRPMLARPGACLALIVTALGLASFNLYGTSVSLVEISATRALMGFGLGLTVPLFAAFAYSGFDEARTASASSLFVFASMMGTGIGVAALGGEFDVASAILDDPLSAYRVVFWTQAIGVLLLLPLIWLLRVRDLTPAKR